MRASSRASKVRPMTEIAAGEPRPSRPSAVWLRLLALLYDPFLWPGELAGMRRRRSAALRDAVGRVVEIGAGTGLNVERYPDGIAELVLVEPDPAMRRRLGRRLERHARVARVVDAPAERLPLPDGSVDTVVSTLVLCTVEEPERALREIARVLRPDGQLLFVEHVRASSPFLAACQDRLLEPWRRFAGGCRCNRPTVDLMRAAGFDVTADAAAWRGMPPIVRPLVVGRATRSARRSARSPASRPGRRRRPRAPARRRRPPRRARRSLRHLHGGPRDRREPARRRRPPLDARGARRPDAPGRRRDRLLSRSRSQVRPGRFARRPKTVWISTLSRGRRRT
jgi:ubiquinone/menaquinone biosynthesis C-methylase UbiE